MSPRTARRVLGVAMAAVALTILAACSDGAAPGTAPALDPNPTLLDAHTPGGLPFEIDGDLEANEADHFDWEVGSAPYPPALHIDDPHSKSAAELDIFKPAGKFAEAENWTIQAGSVGSSQAELTNIWAWAVPPGALGPASPTDAWIVLGMERTKKEGTFALDFELNQVAWTDTSSGPTRTEGDIAVGFELSGNPSDPQEDLQVLIVQYLPDSGQPNACAVTLGNGNKLEAVTSGSDPCPEYGSDTDWYYRFLNDAAVLDASGFGSATMNPTALNYAAGFPSYDAQGNDDTPYVGPFEFAEAAINLSALGIEVGCPGFGSVHAKSRSSLEVGSDLKDLSGPAPLPVTCRIDGSKFLDVDGDGQWDRSDPAQPSDEPGLAGWTIELYQDVEGVWTKVAETTTADGSGDDPLGYYAFENVADGTYEIREVCPAGADPAWVQTAPTPTNGCGSGVHTGVAIDIANTEVNGLDFGNGQPAIAVAKTCPATVALGDDVDYDFDVDNTGNVDLVGVELDDDDIPYEETIGALAVGAEHLTSTSATPASTGEVENTVTVTGAYGGAIVFATVSDTDDCTTTVVDARISIETSDTNFVNAADSSHTFTVSVEKDLGDGGGFVAASGVSVSASESGVGSITGGTCTTGDTDASGQCTVVVDSSATGQSEVDASATVTIDGVDIDVATDGYGAHTVSNVKTWVDARISIETSDTNGIGEPHTFTVTVEKDLGDGGGFVAASGVSVSASESGVGSITGGTCTTGDTDANGECTVVVNSDAAGASTVDASATVTVDGVDIGVATDGYGAATVDNEKTWIDGSLAWDKVDDLGAPLAGATFEACRTHDRLGNDIPDECVAVTDNTAPDADGADGAFLLEDLALGTWTVQETDAPLGYVGDFDRVETVELTLGAPDGFVAEPWVNTPPTEGCTPGFWQGGTGAGLWNEASDGDFTPAYGNPFAHATLFNDFFSPSVPELDGLTMFDLVSTGGGELDARKAARSLVAAYLNAAHDDVNYPLDAFDLEGLWADAVASGEFLALHTQLDTFNNLGCDAD